MKAIQVKVLPATSTKPRRYVAHDGDGNRIVVSCGQYVQPVDAAIALCDKLNWTGELVEGWLERGTTVFVWFVGRTFKV